MTDPFPGRDGTQALDAVPADARPTDALVADPSTALPALPVIALPALPVAADPAAAARWAEADAASARLATDPPPCPRAARADRAAWLDGDAVEAASAASVPVRQAGPTRVLPTPTPTRSAPTRRPTGQRRPTDARRATPVDRPAPRPAAPHRDPEPTAEPEWLRERREEHEFRSEFGEWRAGGRPVSGASTRLRPGTLLVLVALAAVLLVMVLS